VSVAAATNRAGTITVRATNQGMPVEVKIDRAELRYGAQALADQILRLCKSATVAAGAKRRDLLAERGMDDETLDLLGLPTRDAAAAQAAEDDGDSYTPQTWLRPV
jgi:hypothetical protein